MKKVFTPQGHESTPRVSAIVRRVFASAARARFNHLLLVVCLLPLAGYSQNCQLVAGEIIGPTNACAYIGGIGGIATYTVQASDATGFVWVVPSQANLVSGQGTNAIRVKYKNTFRAGDITVKIANDCGESIMRTIRITKAIPAKPLEIAGNSIVCDEVEASTPVTYSIEPVADAVSYRWAVPGQTIVLSGQGTESLTVVFTSRFKAGDIKVRSISGCGFSAYKTLTVTSKGPTTPGPIVGPFTGICGRNNIVEYTISPSSGASSYNWSTSVPGAIITNDGTRAVIEFPPFDDGIVNVTAINRCGASATRRLNVTSMGLTPQGISGPDSVCQATTQTFSVDTVQGAVSYNWSVPPGAFITQGNGTPSITVLMGNESGAVVVRAESDCAPGTPVILQITVEECAQENPACEFSVYPIPTAGILHLRFCAKGSGKYNATVTHTTGVCKVFSISGDYAAGENIICTDLSSLQDGCYILSITTAEFVDQERIEIKH